MKAWLVADRQGYAEYVIIVFAETRGKAISLALGTDAFPSSDWDFTDLCAYRRPMLDGAYRGRSQMEWDDDVDRLTLVKDAGYYCNDDAFDAEDCERCVAKEYCSRYEEYLEEVAEEAEEGTE